MIPLTKKTPTILDELLNYYGGPLSANFRKNIRVYNSMFAFTSFGANIQSDINKSSGPYIFKISGQVHHLIGSLLPINNNSPKFAQLYIYDTDNEIQNRIATFPNNNNENNLNENIVKKLILMLDETNKLVQLFRSVRDVYKNNEIPSMKLRLIGRRQGDSTQYDLPSSSDIGGLIVGDFGLYDNGRDIIIHSQTGELQRINKLHPSYMALQYPLLFPYGEDGYRIDIKWNPNFTGKQPRRNRISMRSFYAFQFQQRLHEGNTLLRAGRLFQQYIVDSYASIEEDRLDYVRQNQNNLRSEIYKGIQDAITRGDTNAEAIGKRIILPSSHTGSPRYMIQNYQDAMAICRHYGNPDIFLTFTCNPKWPEIKRSLNIIAGQRSEDRPDIISRIFKIKLNHLLATIKSGNIFGTIIAGKLFYFKLKKPPLIIIIIFFHNKIKKLIFLLLLFFSRSICCGVSKTWFASLSYAVLVTS